jgi:transcriptional regulator with XRE-family HTH domain
VSRCTNRRVVDIICRKRHFMLFSCRAGALTLLRTRTIKQAAMAKKRNAGIEQRLGTAIAAQRTARGLSQAQLAEVLGVEKDTVSRFERGMFLPPLRRLIQMADFFEMPLEDFIRGSSSNAADAAPEIARKLSLLDKDSREFVRHIVDQLCERLATRR